MSAADDPSAISDETADSPPLRSALAIVGTEFLLHYHIDWLKERILNHNHWDTEQRGFWQVLGADQLLHNFTYVGIVAVLWLRT